MMVHGKQVQLSPSEVETISRISYDARTRVQVSNTVQIRVPYSRKSKSQNQDSEAHFRRILCLNLYSQTQ